MKLAYCIHSLVNTGGTERVLCEKANCLADVYGYDVTIITASQKGLPSCFPLSNKVKTIDIGVNFYGFGRLHKYMRRLEQTLLRIRPDVTISLCNKELFGLAGLRDGSIKMAEYHFSHDRWFLEKGRNSLKAAIRTRRTEKCAAALKRFVVLTKEDAAAWNGISEGLRQIYNPSSFDIHSSTLEEKTVIASGRLCKQKNFELLVKAWAGVAKAHPDWTLRIFGEGEQKPMLSELVCCLGLTGKVVLEGRSNDMQKELGKASACVMSSIYEGFPMALLEAQSQGLPLISTNCPCGPSELIENGVNGFLVPQNDSNALAAAICRIIENPELRKAMGTASLLKAAEFTKEKIMSQWDKLFKELI